MQRADDLRQQCPEFNMVVGCGRQNCVGWKVEGEG